MPFNIKGLQKLADGVPFADGQPPKTLWHYTSPDAMSAIRANNYFQPAKDILKVQDLLWIISANGGTPLHFLAYVNQNDATAIDITDGTQVNATDTD